jgi:hypothetical protein
MCDCFIWALFLTKIVARFFMTIYQNGGNMSNSLYNYQMAIKYMYQMAVIYSQWIWTFLIPRPTKFTQIGTFGFQIPILSGKRVFNYSMNIDKHKFRRYFFPQKVIDYFFKTISFGSIFHKLIRSPWVELENESIRTAGLPDFARSKHTKTGKIIPNYPKQYQTAIQFTKWS